MNKKIIVITLLFCMMPNLHSQERCEDVVYEFSPGRYNILDSSVIIYSQPNVTGLVTGRLNLHSEIEIIEAVENSQTTMEGMSHYWYKIRFNGVTGYVWGGYIAIEASIFDFGGAKVYCYYRVSSIVRYSNDYYVPSVLPNDIFVYFDNRRLNNSVIEEQYKEFKKEYGSEGIRESCYFDFLKRRNFIMFGHSGNGYSDLYIIRENGEIEYSGSVWACG
jgi:hypothetical protein